MYIHCIMTSYFHCRPPLHPTQAKEVASEPSPRGTNTIYYAVIILFCCQAKYLAYGIYYLVVFCYLIGHCDVISYQSEFY